MLTGPPRLPRGNRRPGSRERGPSEPPFLSTALPLRPVKAGAIPGGAELSAAPASAGSLPSPGCFRSCADPRRLRWGTAGVRVFQRWGTGFFVFKQTRKAVIPVITLRKQLPFFKILLGADCKKFTALLSRGMYVAGSSDLDQTQQPYEVTTRLSVKKWGKKSLKFRWVIASFILYFLKTVVQTLFLLLGCRFNFATQSKRPLPINISEPLRGKKLHSHLP